MQLDNAVFTKLSTLGVINQDFFKIGTQATDSNDYLIYNSNSGALSYDADGNGGSAVVIVAMLGVGLALTHADFVVI